MWNTTQRNVKIKIEIKFIIDRSVTYLQFMLVLSVERVQIYYIVQLRQKQIGMSRHIQETNGKFDKFFFEKCIPSGTPDLRISKSIFILKILQYQFQLKQSFWRI